MESVGINERIELVFLLKTETRSNKSGEFDTTALLIRCCVNALLCAEFSKTTGKKRKDVLSLH